MSTAQRSCPGARTVADASVVVAHGSTRGPSAWRSAPVLEAARELLVERGIAELSMRALAGRLGVAPNALYSHVASKTQLQADLVALHLSRGRRVGDPAELSSGANRRGRGRRGRMIACRPVC
ncbi:MAG: helix-turn-helix transcriptional regulator [Frankiales bacterium]|nr:helix-turn-helix transcriptional regulator [Frankiales bacterium]